MSPADRWDSSTESTMNEIADLLDDDGKPIGVREGYACRECIYVDEDDFFHEDNVSD